MTDITGYSQLTITKANAEAREFEGIASTPEIDRMGDSVDPKGATFVNPIPLLLAHDSTQPIGHAWLAPPTAAGIAFRAKISSMTEPDVLCQRLDLAWSSVKSGLMRGISIGFSGLKSERLDSGGRRFTKSEILELSLVVIPANAGATINAATIKHFDRMGMQRSIPAVRRASVVSAMLRTPIESMSDAEFAAHSRRLFNAMSAERADAVSALSALPETVPLDRINDMGERFARAVKNDVGVRLKPIEQRLAAIETRGEVEYLGVFKPGTIYRKGNLVTHHGSLWSCLQDTTDAPGAAAVGWRLAAKRGRDGKDAR
jgi:phage head maturation protease